MMGVEDMALVWFVCGELTTQQELEELCDMLEDWRREIALALRRCVYNGCSGCCGFGYVPNVSEVLTMPDCCD